MKTVIIIGLGLAATTMVGCAEWSQLIAGNEEGVAQTIEGAGTTAGAVVSTLLPPPFGTLAGMVITGVAAWGAERTRSFNKGVAAAVGMVNKGREADTNFNASFANDDAPAVIEMKNLLRENNRLRKAFNKAIPNSEATL